MNGKYQTAARCAKRHALILFSIVIFVATRAALIAEGEPPNQCTTKPLRPVGGLGIQTSEAPRMVRQIHLENSGPPLTVEQISAFEKEIDGRLPDDYKRFLLAHNGRICDPELGLPWAGAIHTVGAFYPLFPPSEDSGIRNAMRHLRILNRVKVDGYVPIAGTTSECEICLGCRGENAGAVFFTAYKYRVAPNSDLIPIDVTMVRIADSFAGLLDYLIEIPNPYCRIEDLGKRGTADDLGRYLAEGHSINAVGKDRRTILCEAIRFGNTVIVRSCIEQGSSLSRSVYMAVQSRRSDLVELLVKAGADINERDEGGATPLFYAVGTEIPGETGAQNRRLREALIRLGAVE